MGSEGSDMNLGRNTGFIYTHPMVMLIVGSRHE